jgi:putative DNA primase/helicase
MNRRRDSIPSELTVRPRWVLWQRDWVDGRYTKVPYQRNGRRASSTDPATWCSWAQVQAAFDRGGYAGIGFVLNGDGLVGVDFDHCYDGSRITIPKIAEYVAMLDTYCEISASGDGLRLFLFGTLPPRDRKEGDIEVYSDKRFLSVSARHLAGTPLTINRRQAQLDSFHSEVFAERIARRARVRPPRITSIVSQSDEELFERIRRSAHGEKFFKLYNEGAYQIYYQDRSVADQWLFSRLEHWTHFDDARVLRLPWQSKMVRPKWNSVDYMERTLARARE